MFPVDTVKWIRTVFFIKNLQWLLLTVLPQNSKFSWGACSLILNIHLLSNLIKNLQKNVAQIILYNHMIKQFLPSLNHDWSCAFTFRLCFGKTLATLILIKKVTQGAAQITIYYHMSEDFLQLRFAVDQFLDIIWKTEESHVSKNIEVKIWQ